MLRALYVDFNSYFASVEQQLRPELRGKPVAVVPMIADTTCAIAASIEAKRFGVKTLTNVADARRLCPEIIFVESRPTVYVEFHQRAKVIVESCAPIASVNSIDEMWIALTGRDQPRAAAEKMALEIKYRLGKQLGECITCSIGIAPNSFLAKTASDMKKPDGLVVIELADLPHALMGLKLNAFVGIGRKMLQRLNDHGINTTPELLGANVEKLREAWGGIEGERFWQKIRGEDVAQRETQTGSISHSHVLAPDVRNHDKAQAILSRLTQKAAMRLRDGAFVTTSIAIAIKLRGGERHKASLRVDATDRTATILSSVQSLYESLLLDRSVRNGSPMQVGMVLGGLTPKVGQSLSLFDTAPNTEKLDRVVDELNLKYGNNTLFWGGAFGSRKSGRMAIAFNHIPDLKTESD
ncbi:MAG: DNA polymerase [Betaproteobacteria bacterium]|nr:MAG: DNA polymerase [Betaproteobacteria bacterium]